MLVQLHVKNFALIREAELELGPGLNVLTGETGAGKSILIDAVNAGLGQRTGAEIIRRGADFAQVELVFRVDEPAVAEKLAALGVFPDEENYLVLSRRISAGRIINKVNGELTGIGALRELTDCLLDIHGQHEHQSLFKTAKHRELLDAFAGCDKELLRCREAFDRYRRAEKALEGFTMKEDERLRRMDFLEYERKEIEDAAIKKGEKAELTERYRRMNHFERIEKSLSSALGRLSGQTDGSAGDAIGRALRDLSAVSGFAPELKSMEEELSSAEDLIATLCREIEDYLSESSFDPRELRETEERLDLIHRLESKYGDLDSGQEKALAEREAEINILRNYEEALAAAEAEKAAAEASLNEASDALHRLRAAAIPELEKAVTEALSELNFASVSFVIRIEEAETAGPAGKDTVEFLVALNPGEEPAPLTKVASGGELSRIMLALKTILADKDEIPSVIFDEIDTGISGRTAQMVGEKLKAIARYRQVILVTHLPQIAALADHHYGITKSSESGSSITSIDLLDENGSVQELARLLGGLEITENVLKTAAELKKKGSALRSLT